MTAKNATRAAFLVEALLDIRYDLNPPENYRNTERWKNGLTPIGMDEADEVFRIEMVEGEDGGGSMHEIATIDRGLARRMFAWLAADIEQELRELGVEPPPDE